MTGSGSRRKILLVDDSSLSRRAMRSILEQAGYAIVEASDGFTAIERYTLERPNLVLLDLVMPGLTGNQVLAQLIEVDPNAKVIVASADIQASTREQARASGAIDYISKPFEREIVLSKVAAALEGSRAPH